jgi:hypothetical protein
MDDRKQRARKLMLTGLALGLTATSISLGLNVEQPARNINIAISAFAVAALLIALMVNVWHDA